jgi:hypothetical protein
MLKKFYKIIHEIRYKTLHRGLIISIVVYFFNVR